MYETSTSAIFEHQDLLLSLSVTDFVAAGGAGNYSWNVIRSEADHLIFKHAGESGAKTFDKTKVTAIEFEPQHKGLNGHANGSTTGVGRPVSASWSQKENEGAGTIRFKYLVDASGRAGLVSTKYTKNRRYNQGLKSIATWGYWEGAGTHGPGVGDPFFEAIAGNYCIIYIQETRRLIHK